MGQKRNKTAILVAICLLTSCGAAFADMFGFSDVAIVKQLIQEVSLLTTMNSNLRQAYVNIKNAGQNITGKSAWIPPASPWQTPTAADTYGNTSGWMNAATNGMGAPAGYAAVTQPLQSYGPAWGSYDPTTQASLSRQYGMIQITDGVTANAIAQNGQIRQSAARSQAAINKLEADQASNDPAKNTQVGVLNIIGGAGVIQARQQAQTTQALTSLVDMQAAELAARRNEQAAEINDDINYRTGVAAISSQHSGGSSALRGFVPR